MASSGPLVREAATSRCPVSDEAALVEQLVSHLPGGLVRKGTEWRFERELAVGRSVADVVISHGRARACCVPTEPLTAFESAILASLRLYGATRIDLLEERCGFVRAGLREGALERLLDWCLVAIAKGGRVAACGPWTDSFGLIAIEAKLTRWRDALRQAISYRRYADRSFVALPTSLAAGALDERKVFTEAGVGLLLVDSDGIKTVVAAPESSDHDWRREFVLSRLAQSE